MPMPSWISFWLARGVSSPSSSCIKGGLSRAFSKVTRCPKLGPVRDTNTISPLNPGVMPRGSQAVQVFRTRLWEGDQPGSGCQFTVEVHRDTPQIHEVMLRQVENNARYGTTKGPVAVVRKQRLRGCWGLQKTKD